MESIRCKDDVLCDLGILAQLQNIEKPSGEC